MGGEGRGLDETWTHSNHPLHRESLSTNWITLSSRLHLPRSRRSLSLRVTRDLVNLDPLPRCIIQIVRSSLLVLPRASRIIHPATTPLTHGFDLKLRDRLISPNINSSTSLSVDPHESMISLKFVSQERAFSDEPRIYRTISRKFFLLLLFVKKSKNQCFINHKRITRGRRHGNLKVKISLLLLCSSLRKFLLETFRRESWKRTRRH